MIRILRKVFVVQTVGLMAALLCLTSCVQQGPPETRPQKPNAISLNPQDWYIFYSAEMPPHPSADSLGAWSLDFPSLPAGHVGYVQTPFNATGILHRLTLTFIVKSDAPKYHVMDPSDIPPATVHVFLERQNDNLTEADGRWWADPSKYDLGSGDDRSITMIIPLTPDAWTDVYGQSDSKSFYDSLANVGWIGITFGGQYFWGHGVAMEAGSSKYVLQGFSVD